MASGGGHEPNLTPFVDLFSVLICFLLMTAAWTQLESFQVQIEQKPKLNPELTSATPPPEKDEKEVKLSLHLKGDHLLAFMNEEEHRFPMTGENPSSEQLKSLLKSWELRFGSDKNLVIHSSDEATYGQLVKLYDFVNFMGWSKVAINPY